MHTILPHSDKGTALSGRFASLLKRSTPPLSSIRPMYNDSSLPGFHRGLIILHVKAFLALNMNLSMLTSFLPFVWWVAPQIAFDPHLLGTIGLLGVS